MDLNEKLTEEIETIVNLTDHEKLIKARERIITMDAADIEILLEELPREKMVRVCIYEERLAKIYN